MPFPSNPPLPKEICFLSEEQETALCAHTRVCLSLIVSSQVLRYLCHVCALSLSARIPPLSDQPAVWLKQYETRNLFFFFLKAHFKMEENCNFQDRLIQELKGGPGPIWTCRCSHGVQAVGLAITWVETMFSLTRSLAHFKVNLGSCRTCNYTSKHNVVMENALLNLK